MFFILLELFNCETNYEKYCKGTASITEDCFIAKYYEDKPDDTYCCFIKGEVNNLNISECQIFYKEEYKNLEKVKENYKNLGFSQIYIYCDELFSSSYCNNYNPLNENECFERITLYQKYQGFQCCYGEYVFNKEKFKYCNFLDKEIEKLIKEEIKTIEKEYNIKYKLECGDDYYFHNINYYLFYLILLIINIIIQ